MVSQFMLKKDFLLHGTYLQKTLQILTLQILLLACFCLSLLYSVSYFFFLYQSPSLSFCMVLGSVSSNIDEVLSINPSANVFVFGDFNVHHKDGLPILAELIDLVNSVIIFLPQMTGWLTFRLGSQTVILIVLLFWISFFLLMLVFVL